MKVDIFNKNGNKTGEVELNESIFGFKPNLAVLAQYIRVFLTNQRQGNASTKTRGEVSGTGKKPWRQKGTGRARVGQTRNPVWRHGGVAHGPKPKTFSLSIPKKLRKIALFTALSLKNNPKSLKIIEKIDLNETKTKELFGYIKDLKARGKVIIITSSVDSKLLNASQNLRDISVQTVIGLNAFQIVKSDVVLIEKDALKVLEDTYVKA